MVLDPLYNDIGFSTGAMDCQRVRSLQRQLKLILKYPIDQWALFSCKPHQSVVLFNLSVLISGG